MFEGIAIAAIGVLAFLTYLVFFEKGPRYGLPTTTITEDDLLARWRTVLSVPELRVEAHELIFSGEHFYDAHAELIESAERTINMELYIMEPGNACTRILAALTAKAAQGVSVRLVLDRVGSLKMRRKHFDALAAAGGRIAFYHPLGVHTFRRLNNRTHRNLLIVDDERALISGAGLADFWCRAQDAWRDCALRVEGSAVLGLQSAFGENWLETTGEILTEGNTLPAVSAATEGAPSFVIGSSPVAGGSSPARVLFQLAIASARHSIHLCSPYFVPDRGIRDALIAATRRGVRVQILTSGRRSDQGLARRAGRRRYGSLLKGGVEIFEHRHEMMHVKALVIDEKFTILGTTNVDNRSFNLNDEVNIVLANESLAQRMTAMFSDEPARLEAITLKDWHNRDWSERLLAFLGRGIERHD